MDEKKWSLVLMSALIAVMAVGCNGAKEADGGTSGSSSSAADGKLSFTMSMATSGNKHAERSKDVNEEMGEGA